MQFKYPFNTRQLSNDEGGGYLIEFPALPGCMSDGDTVHEAISNGQGAIDAWMEEAKALKRLIPAPSE